MAIFSPHSEPKPEVPEQFVKVPYHRSEHTSTFQERLNEFNGRLHDHDPQAISVSVAAGFVAFLAIANGGSAVVSALTHHASGEVLGDPDRVASGPAIPASSQNNANTLPTPSGVFNTTEAPTPNQNADPMVEIDECTLTFTAITQNGRTVYKTTPVVRGQNLDSPYLYMLAPGIDKTTGDDINDYEQGIRPFVYDPQRNISNTISIVNIYDTPIQNDPGKLSQPFGENVPDGNIYVCDGDYPE